MIAFYATMIKDVLKNFQNKMFNNVEKLTSTPQSDHEAFQRKAEWLRGLRVDCGTLFDMLTSRIIYVIRDICHADQE